MADQKKLKKKALKAYDKAEDAVADARKAVDEARRRAKELTKKSRPKVSPLEDALDTAAAGLGGAKKELKKAKQASEAPSTSGKGSSEGSSASANDSASAGDSSSTSSATPAEQRSIYTPPLPEVDETTVQTADGHDAHVDLHAQTLVALRALARTKGVTNVSRYTKAALIEKIEQA